MSSGSGSHYWTMRMECRKLRWQDYPLMCPRPSQGCLVKKSVPTPSLSCALYFKAKLGGLSLNISLLSFWSGMQSHLLLGWRKAFDRLWLDSFEKDRILQKKLTINSPKNRKPKQESQNSTSHQNIQSGKMLAQWSGDLSKSADHLIWLSKMTFCESEARAHVHSDPRAFRSMNSTGMKI